MKKLLLVTALAAFTLLGATSVSAQEVSASTDSAAVLSSDAGKRVKRDSGGVSEICHYYDDGEYKNYTFRCYNDMGFRGWRLTLKPIGSHVTKTVSRSHSLFQDAKNSVDSLASDLHSAENSTGALILATAAEAKALSSKNVVTAVVAGSAMAYETYMAGDGWLDAKESLRKAYGYIDNM